MTARIHPRLPPCIGDQQQRQRPLNLGIIRSQRVDQPGLIYRLVTQVAGRRQAIRGWPLGISGVENQIDHRQHRLQPRGPLLGPRHGKGDARLRDLGLGAAQALAHGGVLIQKIRGNFGGGQATQGAQGQGNLRLQLQRRMATGKNQAQPFIGNHLGFRFIGFVSGQSGHVGGIAVGAGGTADPVNGLAQGHAQQPALR